MNLNGKQVISIIIAVLSVLMVSGAQLNDLIGASASKTVVSLAGLLNLILGSVMAAISGNLTQPQQVQQVLNMKGIDRISVNALAPPSVAAMAVNPDINKIAPTAGAQDAVEAIAAKAV